MASLENCDTWTPRNLTKGQWNCKRIGIQTKIAFKTKDFLAKKDELWLMISKQSPGLIIQLKHVKNDTNKATKVNKLKYTAQSINILHRAETYNIPFTIMRAAKWRLSPLVYQSNTIQREITQVTHPIDCNSRIGCGSVLLQFMCSWSWSTSL